jgi:2',3'-cyclic-nucleotide 2'-phosphodiesterase (5'-nucleotidase family)
MSNSTVSTLLGDVTITDVTMSRAFGYGQYLIIIDIDFEGQGACVKVHSTDHKLWDDLQDEETDKEAFLMVRAKSTIETAIENYIGSL